MSTCQQVVTEVMGNRRVLLNLETPSDLGSIVFGTTTLLVPERKKNSSDTNPLFIPNEISFCLMPCQKGPLAVRHQEHFKP